MVVRVLPPVEPDRHEPAVRVDRDPREELVVPRGPPVRAGADRDRVRPGGAAGRATGSHRYRRCPCRGCSSCTRTRACPSPGCTPSRSCSACGTRCSGSGRTRPGCRPTCPGLLTWTRPRSSRRRSSSGWNRRPWSSEVLHSSRTYATSSAPFFSTTGTENWLARIPTPPAPGVVGHDVLVLPDRERGVLRGHRVGVRELDRTGVAGAVVKDVEPRVRHVQPAVVGAAGLLSTSMYSLSLNECVVDRARRRSRSSTRRWPPADPASTSRRCRATCRSGPRTCGSCRKKHSCAR